MSDATASPHPRHLTVNGRTYDWPRQPLVVVCVDGCEPDYLTQAVAAGAMPWLGPTLAPRHQSPRGLRDPELHQSQ